jgi:hypothetical protein
LSRLNARSRQGWSKRNLVVGLATFVVTTVVFLSIAVSTGLATVGWHTIGTAEVLLSSGGFVSTNSPVYSADMRMYQNLNQVDSSDPPLDIIYRYPSGIIYTDVFAFWNSGSPVYMGTSGGNKAASCENNPAYHKSAGRVITCQFYSTV